MKYHQPILLDMDNSSVKTIVEVRIDDDAPSAESVLNEVKDQMPFSYNLGKDSALTTIYTIGYK